MPTLHIALQDGFSGQRVQIWIDTRKVYDRANVRTDLRISRADAVDVALPGGPVRVSITIMPGDIIGVTSVDSRVTPYLAINLDEGALVRWTPSSEPFRYL